MRPSICYIFITIAIAFYWLVPLPFYYVIVSFTGGFMLWEIYRFTPGETMVNVSTRLSVTGGVLLVLSLAVGELFHAFIALSVFMVGHSIIEFKRQSAGLAVQTPKPPTTKNQEISSPPDDVGKQLGIQIAQSFEIMMVMIEQLQKENQQALILMQEHYQDDRDNKYQQQLNMLTTLFENQQGVIESYVRKFGIEAYDDVKEMLESYKEEIKDNNVKLFDEMETFLEQQRQSLIKVVTRPLKNAEISQHLYRALREAEYEVGIISPWVYESVFKTTELESLMIDALKRGVTIKIVYGINGKQAHKQIQSESGIKYLEKKFRRKKYNGKMLLREHNSHYKMFSCDNKFYVSTSMNVLSNPGATERNNGFAWEEGGTYSTDHEQLEYYRQLYFDDSYFRDVAQQKSS